MIGVYNNNNNRFTALKSRITRVSQCSHKAETNWNNYRTLWARCPSCHSTDGVYRNGRFMFYRHGISTPCLTNSVKALKEYINCVKITAHGKCIYSEYWRLRADVKRSESLPSRVCCWLKERWGPVDVFSTGWRQQGPQKLCTNYPSWNVLSLHSSSFTIVPLLSKKDMVGCC